WPFVDSLVALIVHGDAELAWEMTAMNMQALAVTNFFTDLTKNTVRRKRPDGAHCTDEATCNVQDRSASFFSGHTSMSFTAAGLTCAHHGAVDLYGGGAGDTIACVAAVSLASLTGVMRIAADRHHTTDVMLGA